MKRNFEQELEEEIAAMGGDLGCRIRNGRVVRFMPPIELLDAVALGSGMRKIAAEIKLAEMEEEYRKLPMATPLDLARQYHDNAVNNFNRLEREFPLGSGMGRSVKRDARKALSLNEERLREMESAE